MRHSLVFLALLVTSCHTEWVPFQGISEEDGTHSPALYATHEHHFGFINFITRKGAKLYDGAQEFRFMSFLAPELHRFEDDAKGKCLQDSREWGQYFGWPLPEEQENHIQSMVLSGLTVTRIYTLSIEQEDDQHCGRETHIRRPRTPGETPTLDENSMVHYDRMIYLAEKHHLRIIAPIIDHWEWWGGRKQLAAFYGESEDQFYDVNSQTYKAYQAIIRQLITRKNTYTGRFYWEEKAIMGWETGNELKGSHKTFLRTTAAYIRSLAPHQLIIDGTYTRINSFALDDPHIDIVSNHFYENALNLSPDQVVKDLKAVQGKKVYIVGEYGLAPLNLLEDITQAVIHTSVDGHKAAGGLIWGLRGRRYNGGFYFHHESPGYRSYRLPGFPEADDIQEMAVIGMVRKGQAELLGLKNAPPLPMPEAPRLLPIKDRYRITWMGSTVARTYRIERASTLSGPWQTIADGVSDGHTGFDPTKSSLFEDPAAKTSYDDFFYRVYAANESGESPASQPMANHP